MKTKSRPNALQARRKAKNKEKSREKTRALKAFEAQGSNYSKKVNHSGKTSILAELILNGLLIKASLTQQGVGGQTSGGNGTSASFRGKVSIIDPCTGKIMIHTDGNNSALVQCEVYPTSSEDDVIKVIIFKAASKLYDKHCSFCEERKAHAAFLSPLSSSESEVKKKKIKRVNPSAKISQLEKRRVMTENERKSVFEILEKNPDEMAVMAALALGGGIPHQYSAKLTPNCFIQLNSEIICVDMKDTDIGEERSGATHILTTPLMPQAARVVYAYINKSKVKKAASFPNLAAHPELTTSRFERYVKDLLSKVREMHAGDNEAAKLADGTSVLTDTYNYIIERYCGISDENTGTSRYLKHQSMEASATDDHYASYSGEEAWRQQFTYLNRQVPEEPIRRQEVMIEENDFCKETITPKTTQHTLREKQTFLMPPGGEISYSSEGMIAGWIEEIAPVELEKNDA